MGEARPWLEWSVVILQGEGLHLRRRENSCSFLHSWSLPTISKGITAQPEYQDLHSFHKSSWALPTQQQQVRMKSFPTPVHLVLACSYAAPTQLLSKTSPSTCWLSMVPFATWLQAGTLLTKAATPHSFGPDRGAVAQRRQPSHAIVLRCLNVQGDQMAWYGARALDHFQRHLPT